MLGEAMLVDALRARQDELERAAMLIHAADEPDAPYYTQLGAVRYLHHVLHGIGKDDGFWGDIYSCVSASAAKGPPFSDINRLDIIRSAVADLLSAQLAEILIRTGYKVPPPPPASDLIDSTRKVVTNVPENPESWGRQVEVARAALNHFTIQVAAHIPKADSRTLVRILRHGRKVVPALGLVGAIARWFVIGDPDIQGLLETVHVFDGAPSSQDFNPQDFNLPFAKSLGSAASVINLEETARSSWEELARW
jgi:hypothetical protein